MENNAFSNKFSEPTNNFSDTPEVRDTPRSIQSNDQFRWNQGNLDTFDPLQPGWQSSMNHLQNYTDNQRGLTLQEHHRRAYGFPEFNQGSLVATYTQQPSPAPLASTTRQPFGEAQQASRYGAFSGTQVSQTNTETPRWAINATTPSFPNFQHSENLGFRSGNRVYGRRDQGSLIEQHRSSNQYHRPLERGPSRLQEAINGAQNDTDQNPFAQLLGSNLTHFVNEIEPFLDHNMRIPPNFPIPAQPLAARHRLAPPNLRDPIPAERQLERRHAPLSNSRAQSPYQPKPSPPSNNNPSSPNQTPDPNETKKNPKHARARARDRARTPQRPEPPARAMGTRAQRSTRLHEAGQCIWCGEPNPDLSRMGCPECRRGRVTLTRRWR
jgi:hypothetical protein